ncbi:MAG: SAM-dependent methyltransferase [Betaproteobacteria bacterium]|nr:SAM-dependent methyltransferase [Betaproteobacteria bacterium]
MSDPITDPQKFMLRLQQSLDDASFLSLSLGRPQGGEPSLDKLLARRLVLRGVEQLSLVWRHRTKDITKNLPLADAVALIGTLVDSQFQHAHLVTRGHDIQLAMGKKGRWSLRIGKLAAPFLLELGITDSQHRLVPTMARKWKQINKFIEVLAHAVAQSPLAARDPAQPVRVLDFGAGKGYLTFAVQQHLQASARVPDVVGVELRADLTSFCNSAVARLGLSGLRFEAGDIRQFTNAQHQTDGQPQTPGTIDIMIALHACDIATDIAMHHGVRSGAAIILCSPCCHQQLRPQMSAPAPLQAMLQHGIHMTEQAEMLTDSLRAMLLQACGYDAQVFEFISPEHTGKNKMVLAVRRPHPLPASQRTALLAKVAELKAFYGVTAQQLETLLLADTPQAQ